MEIDFRVDACLFDNHKIQRLLRRLGDTGFRCLIRLWAWTRQHRPSGVLTGLDDEGVAIAAGWPENRPADQFISALSELILIERTDRKSPWLVHDWQATNPWATAQTARQQHAVRLNHERWHVQRGLTDPLCSQCVPSEPHQSGISTDIRRTGTDIRTDLLTDSSVPYGTDPNRRSTRSTSPSCATSGEASPGPRRRGKTTSARTYDDASIAMQLARQLLARIREHTPQFSEPDLQKWADVFRLILERDRRDAAQVREVIDFTTADARFWQRNVLSPGALRGQTRSGADKFETILAQMRDHSAPAPSRGSVVPFSHATAHAFVEDSEWNRKH